MAQHDDIAERRLIEQQRRDRHQRIEPAAGLIDRLGDKVCRELLVEQLLVFKGIMMLGKRHRTGIEPAVDHLRHAVHLLAAVGAGDGDSVDIGAVQLNILRAVWGHLFELLDAADRMAAAAFALPDIQRGAPVPVAADAPILHVFQPVAEAALADGRGNPVDGVVVADQIFANRGHLDKPGFSRVIDQRGVAAPAERVAVLKLRRGEQQPPRFQVIQNQRIGVFDKHAGPRGFLCHLALAIHQLNERQAVGTAHAGVVLTERGRDMNHAGTVRQCDVTVAGDEPALLLRLHEGEQRLIFLVFQIGADKVFQNFGVLAENGAHKLRRHIVNGIVFFNLYISFVGVHTKAHVRGQRPRGGRPRQNVGVFSLYLELDNRGALLDVLIPLRHLVARQRRSAARAVGNDLEALVEKLFFPNLFECPPFGLDKVVVIGDIGVIHVHPEAHRAGEILPHALVLPDAFLTFIDERLQAIGLNLILAVDVQQLFHFQLHGQAMRIPAGLARHLLALHGLVAGQQIFDDAGQHMADVRLAVCRGRAVIENIRRSLAAGFHAFFKHMVFLPILLHFFFTVHKMKVCGYFLIHALYLLQYYTHANKKTFVLNQDEGQASLYHPFTYRHMLSR